MSDRLAVMDAGRIEQVDTPAGIYNRPDSRFVAGFVGDINLVDVALDGGRATSASGRSLAPPGQGCMDGHMHDLSFIGDQVLLVVSTETGRVLVKQRPSAADPGPARGDPVGLCWDAGNAVLLPAA